MDIRDEIADFNEEALLLAEDIFDEAIIGVLQRIGMSPIAVYDEEKLLTILMKEYEMSYEDAYEHYSYNIMGSYVGEGTPGFIIRLRD